MTKIILLFCSFAVAAFGTVNQVVDTGGSFTLSVSVQGTAPFTYQWLKDARDGAGAKEIAGATASTYSVGPVIATDAGNYSVRITNSAGVAFSDTAIITVNPPPVLPPSKPAIAVVSKPAPTP